MKKFPRRALSTTKITIISSRSCKWCQIGVKTTVWRTWSRRAQGTPSWRIIRFCIKASTIGLTPRTSRALYKKFRWDLASTRRIAQLQSLLAPQMTLLSSNYKRTQTFTLRTSLNLTIARTCSSTVRTQLFTQRLLTREFTTPSIWITRCRPKGSQPMLMLTNGPYLNMISEYNNSP